MIIFRAAYGRFKLINDSHMKINVLFYFKFKLNMTTNLHQFFGWVEFDEFTWKKITVSRSQPFMILLVNEYIFFGNIYKVDIT